MARGDFDPEAMLSTLADHRVRFVLIGGMAAVLHGDVGVTVEMEAANRLKILVASLEAVIRSKQAAGREKDRLALPRLRRLRDRIRRAD